MANEPLSPKRTRKKKVSEPVVRDSISYHGLEKERLRDFIMFALGDPLLTPYEANFVNGLKHRLIFDPMYISKKQEAIIEQIKEKLHYNKREVPQIRQDDDYVEPEMEVDEFGNWSVKNKYDNGFGDNESDGIVVVEEFKPR
jgi:hypothetical protein